MRLLLVGTYRDVEVDRAHPLSAALTELRRGRQFRARATARTVGRRGTANASVEASQQTIPRPFAELVHRQTEGNPLFVHEMLRFVVEEGLVERRDGALRRVGDESLAGRIPEGLRDAVGKRLSRLSETTNRVLSVASVIGREFQLDVLRQVLASRRGGRACAGRGGGRGDHRRAICRRHQRSPIASATRSFADAVRRDHGAADGSDCISRSRARWKRSMRAGWKSTRPNWRSITRSPPTRWTWRRQSTTGNWRPDAPWTCLRTAKRRINSSGRW